MTRILPISLTLVALFCVPVAAGVKSKAAREAAEYISKKFGKELGEETVETLAEKIGKYSVRYGDDAVDAIRKVGPRGFKLIDDAGENAPGVVRLLNQYGKEAVWVVSEPKRLALFVKHGDEAAKAMMAHPGIAAPAIEKFGQPAARALQKVSSQNARRLGMMADDGSLTAAGKADELLGVVGKYGDKAADFIWRHKGALAVTAVAAAFIANPEPFIDGTKDLAEIAVRPIDSAAKEMGKGVAEGANWTIVIVSLGSLIVLLAALRFWRPWKRAHRRQEAEPQKVSTGDEAPDRPDASKRATLER